MGQPLVASHPHDFSQLPPQHSTAYYSPPFPPQSGPQHIQQQQQHQPRPMPFQQAFPTVHPSELSPPESRTSVSPLSAYTDVSGSSLACDPHSQLSQWPSSEEERRASMASEMGIELPGMVEASVPGMSVIGINPMEADAAGEEDAEGEEDWEHASPQLAHMASQESLYHQQEMERQEESSHHGAARVRRQPQSRGQVEVTFDSGDDFEESESDEDDDDDDDEFVLSTRRRVRSNTGPSRRRGPNAPGNSYASDGGFAVRTRSGSTRYNPYNAYSDASGYYTGDQGAFDQAAYEHNRRRYNSSSSCSLSPTLSSASVSHLTTSTTRRRIRPSPSLPVPVPVPNLTKKSRGRRVPTMESLEDLRSAASGAGKKRQSAGGKTARMYLCDVEGCGKCFARGERGT